MTQQPTPCGTHYYRATPIAKMPAIVDAVRERSAYLHDVLMLCHRGAWELELRQFLPPASLQRSLASLMELRLIECYDQPVQAAAA